MPTPLPEPPGAVVHRPRLSRLIDGAMSRCVTLLTAPPGWGKTSAVRTWLDHRVSSGPVAWISLDPADPHDRDVAGRVAALQRTQSTEPAVLVVDDVHLGDAALWQTLDQLVRLPQLRLVLATRDDSALPVPRWRLCDQVTEIGYADLAFTFDEAAHMLAVHEMTLTMSQIEALHARTEGWPAGVRFAAQHGGPSLRRPRRGPQRRGSHPP